MKHSKTLLALLLALACLVPLTGQNTAAQSAKPRVAVLPFAGGTGTDGEVLGRLFANEIANMGTFTVLPRTAAVDAAMKEIDFQKIGLTDPTSIAKVGKSMNATYVIAGFISKLGNINLLEVSMIEVETLVQTAGASKTYVDIGEGVTAMPHLVSTILDASSKSMPQPAAQKADASGNKTYQIGDFGPAGGIVFYDKGVVSNGWRYLEAAPPELEFQAAWGAYEKNVNGTGLAVGSGKRNTEIIVAYLKSIGETGKAAQLAATTSFDGYTDWFLPSKDELDLMYKNLKVKKLGGFGDGWYWSSSQASTDNAWYQRFSDGRQASDANYRKDNSNSVRVVRAF